MLDYKELMSMYNFGNVEITELNLTNYNTDYNQTVISLLKEIQEFDFETYKHSVRVGLIALNIAKAMNYDKVVQSTAYLGGLVHDVGKIFVPVRILNKPEKLTEEELNIIRLHPILGTGYTCQKLPFNIIRIIRDHHEKLDGSGYPKGLDYNDINVPTRVVTLADVIDGISSQRVYHKSKNHQETMNFIQYEKGLDENIVQTLLKTEDFHFKRIQRSMIEGNQ